MKRENIYLLANERWKKYAIEWSQGVFTSFLVRIRFPQWVTSSSYTPEKIRDVITEVTKHTPQITCNYDKRNRNQLYEVIFVLLP